MIIDQYGMIISGSDGGDSCHRMYTAFIRLRLQYLVGAIKSVPAPFDNIADPAKTQLELEPHQDGIYIRNPDPEKWYSDPRNFSRDQMVPAMCYHTLMTNSIAKPLANQARRYQARLLKACLKRYMFAQNTYPNWIDVKDYNDKNKKTPDFLNFELWGIFARAFIKTRWAPLALPFIVLGDTFLIFSALFKCFAPINEDGTLKFRLPGPNDVDDDNMNNTLMITQYVFPTPLSWLARKIYKRFRPQNNGNTQLGEKSSIMGALMWYHRNDNPEMAELARPMVERY